MNILFCLPSYHPGYGGPFFSVGHLASSLTLHGHKIGVLTSDFPRLPVTPPPNNVEQFPLPAKELPVLGIYICDGKKRVQRILDDFQPDIIHDNGLWLQQNHLVAGLGHASGIPLVHSPRGCLDPWAMKHRNWKKQVALRLYQRRDLEKVRSFHVTSELEVESIRKMGFTRPIEMIPNGIEIPQWIEESGTEGSQKNDNRYALFMGRLHPIKNLPTLLEAWQRVKPEGWTLQLVGSDEEAHREALRKQAEQLGISDRIEFLEPVYGTEKWRIIRNASLAVLISHSENFGLSAAEALGCGVPVIASKTTPWQSLESEKIGWWVPGTVNGVSEALSEAIQLSDADRKTMGARAARFVREAFSWETVTERFIRLYEECMT